MNYFYDSVLVIVTSYITNKMISHILVKGKDRVYIYIFGPDSSEIESVYELVSSDLDGPRKFIVF